MSSTKRSNSRNMHQSDYYITPIDQIDLFIDAFLKTEKISKDIKILDPCAGGDDANLMSYPTSLMNNGFENIDTIDIRMDSKASNIGNYLNMNCKNKYDMIITNPPFNIARDIIEKALEDVKEDGYVIMLLRLNYFGSKSRIDLWEKYFPTYSFVHHKRICFTGNGKTDSIEYQHLVFKKNQKPEFCKLKVI